METTEIAEKCYFKITKSDEKCYFKITFRIFAASLQERIDMSIEDLYINSDRLVANVSMEHKRYLYREINWESRMVCIRGARGVGKTTLLKQYLKENHLANHKALYITLDDFWFTNHHLIDVAEYHYLHGGTTLFIDEVHHYPFPTWPLELKNIYDRYPEMKIVFTGSSILQIDNSMADLSRRCIFYTLHGMSFREYLEFNKILSHGSVGLEDLLNDHVKIALDITNKIKVLPLFADYLRHGYYPFYTEVKASYGKVLQQVAANIIEVDVPAVENIEYSTVTKLKRLFALISQMVPFTINISEMSKSVDCSRQAVSKMLALLNKAALVNLLYNGKNTMNQLSKPEKVYLENTNLMYALTSRADTGNVRETFFANMLMRNHEVTFSGSGDFLIDGKFTFEVGGKNKSFDQIKGIPNSYLALDDIETGYGAKIPLWLFGFIG